MRTRAGMFRLLLFVSALAMLVLIAGAPRGYGG